MTSTVHDHPYYVRYTGVAWSACPKGFRTGSPKGFNDMCHFCLGCNTLSHPERPERAFKPEVPRIHEDFQLGCANEKPSPIRNPSRHCAFPSNLRHKNPRRSRDFSESVIRRPSSAGGSWTIYWVSLAISRTCASPAPTVLQRHRKRCIHQLRLGISTKALSWWTENRK